MSLYHSRRPKRPLHPYPHPRLSHRLLHLFHHKPTGAYNNRGSAYSDLGENQRAIEDYDKIIQLNSDHAMAYYNRGRAYSDVGEHHCAIQLDPNDTLADTNRGKTYQALVQASSWMARGKWSSKAREDFDKVRSLGME